VRASNLAPCVSFSPLVAGLLPDEKNDQKGAQRFWGRSSKRLLID